MALLKQNYDLEAAKLARAIDIAIEAFSKFPPEGFTQANTDHIINRHLGWKHAVLNPEPKFKKMASLNYKIADVFTFFQEGTGEAVEYFWQQLAKEVLGYVRTDKLRKIIERGKIKGRIEYEYVADQVLVAEQCSRITKEESLKLNTMLGDFEKGRKR